MRFLNVSACAALLRKALAESWPNTRFSVRSKRYAGGASITVTWTDGPTEAQVRAVSDRFASARFDGMTDSTSYVQHQLDGQPVSLGSHYVNTQRYVSDDLLNRGIAAVAAAAGPCHPITPEYWRAGLAWDWMADDGTDLATQLTRWLEGRDGIADPYPGVPPLPSPTLARLDIAPDRAGS